MNGGAADSLGGPSIDIYPSGTQPIPGVTGRLVVQAVMAAHPRAITWTSS